MQECLFCKIAQHKLPASIVYEDDEVVAFIDSHPKAPVHLLVIPKTHIAGVDDLQPSDQPRMGAMVLVAQKLAREQGIAQTGYRLVINVREHGGQVVDHLHLHLIGGKKLGAMA